MCNLGKINSLVNVTTKLMLFLYLHNTISSLQRKQCKHPHLMQRYCLMYNTVSIVHQYLYLQCNQIFTLSKYYNNEMKYNFLLNQIGGHLTDIGLIIYL